MSEMHHDFSNYPNDFVGSTELRDFQVVEPKIIFLHKLYVIDKPFHISA